MTPLLARLVALVVAEAELPAIAVDAETPIYRYGLDSRALMRIVEAAEAEFSLLADLDRVSPAETIAALAEAFAPA